MPGMESYGPAADSGWGRFSELYNEDSLRVVRNPRSDMSDQERQRSFESFHIPQEERDSIMETRRTYLAGVALADTLES